MTIERIAALLGRIIDARTDFDLAMIEAQIVKEESSREGVAPGLIGMPCP